MPNNSTSKTKFDLDVHSVLQNPITRVLFVFLDGDHDNGVEENERRVSVLLKKTYCRLFANLKPISFFSGP